MPEPTTTAEQLNDLRRRYLAGEEWTREELSSAIHTMIGDRLNEVQNAGAAKTKKTKAAPVSLDDMLPGAIKVIGVDKASDKNPDKTVAVTRVGKEITDIKVIESKPPANTSGFF